MFVHLLETSKRAHDPTPFFNIYRNADGEKCDPHIQMDTLEFFNVLTDKVESELKANKETDVLYETFRGRFANQVVSKVSLA